MSLFGKLPILTAMACSLSTLSASAVVVYKPSFDESDSFILEGRSSVSDSGLRMLGGSYTSSVSSPLIDVSNYSNLKFTFSRNTNRLDSGELGIAQISINEEDFITLESVQNASGPVEFNLSYSTEIRSVRLRFSLSASSFFENYSISDILIEGDRDDCAEGCSPNDPPSPQGHTVILPDASWDCSLPSGIPDPNTGTLLFTATLTRGPLRDIGLTPFGHRKVLPANGGQIQPGNFGSTPIQGRIEDNALDTDLHLPSGAIEHESRYVINTTDRTLIYMRNCGVADGENIRFVTDFEAPENSRYAWLNRGRYIGIRKINGDKIELEVYGNPTAKESDTRIQVEADNDLRQQMWECPIQPPHMRQGSEVVTLRVGIGGFQTIGTSKNGDRRIINITGGSFNGDINGSVDPGGADYQLTQNGDLSLEARYTIQAQNGETILVRNCGDFGESDLTLPLFESSIEGAYNWLNDTDFVGTITPGLGRVTIRVYNPL